MGGPGAIHCRPCVSLVPNYPTTHCIASAPPPSHRLPHCAMTTIDPWGIGDIPPDVSNCSTTTVVLNTGIKTLIGFKDIVEIAPVKAVFESAIVILTLVRVSLLVPFP